MKLQANVKELIQEFIELVKIDSESLHCGKMITYLHRVFKKHLGMTLYEQKTKESSNLIGKIGNGKPLMLSAHMDTVTPGLNIKPKILKDRIVSSGDTILAADDKSAIAVYLYVLKLVKKYNLPILPLEIVFTYGEEIGLLGAKNLDFKKITAKEGICFDADGDVGEIYISAPYYIKFSLDVKGKAAHAGIEPEKGISAIKVLSDIISKISIGRLNKTTTLNIGHISGGTALNIVAPFAQASGEIRSVQYDRALGVLDKIKTIANTVAKKYKVSVQVKSQKVFQGFQIDKKDKFLKRVLLSFEKEKIRPKLLHSNGGSDANIFNAKGIKTLNLAIGMTNAHTTKEFIKIKNLKAAVSVLLDIISKKEVEILW